MNLILAYIQYRYKALFTIRKKDAFVGEIHNYLKNGSENIDFEEVLQGFRDISKSSNRTISIQDFGAGSKKLGNERSISAIYKTSVASSKFQRLLFHLAKNRECKNILEMGTSLGYSSVYLAKAGFGKVTTIEACPAIFKEAESLFQNMKLNNIFPVNSTFVEYFEKEKNLVFDLVYIDGHHDGEALLKYVEILKPQLSTNAVVVVDDIRWSKGMHEAWTKLRIDPHFSSNVDLFRMGVLSFNKTQI